MLYENNVLLKARELNRTMNCWNFKPTKYNLVQGIDATSKDTQILVNTHKFSMIEWKWKEKVCKTLNISIYVCFILFYSFVVFNIIDTDK